MITFCLLLCGFFVVGSIFLTLLKSFFVVLAFVFEAFLLITCFTICGILGILIFIAIDVLVGMVIAKIIIK